MVDPAPGLFSMTMGWPSRSASAGAIRRAAMSLAPPGGNVTTRRIGRSGQAEARAARGRAKGNANALASMNFRRESGMAGLLHDGRAGGKGAYCRKPDNA
ncbi:hypothetical protein D3C72_1685370 [compost metagenome]